MALSPEETKEYHQAFNFADRDHDGKIGPGELGLVLRAVGFSPSEKDLKAIGDKLGGKPIDFEGFLRVCSENSKKIVSDEVLQAFKKFDKDKSGMVSTHEVRHALLTLGEKFSDQEVEAFTASVGGVDKINYKEFVAEMAKYK